jgi:hypothetical protein
MITLALVVIAAVLLRAACKSGRMWGSAPVGREWSKQPVAIALGKAAAALAAAMAWAYVCAKLSPTVIPDTNFGVAVTFGPPLVLLVVAVIFGNRAITSFLEGGPK